MRVFEHSLVDPPRMREEAKGIGAILLRRIASAPTHSDPAVPGLIAGVLSGR